MPNARETKNRLYEQFAHLAKAMASPKRLELLDLLCQCEKTVEVLAEQSFISIANTSRHLQILRVARLVETRKVGVHVFYKLADEKVCEFFRSLLLLANSRLAEIDRIIADFFDTPDNLQPVNRKKLISRAKVGEVVVLDVRPEDEYQTAHLPYARSIPLSKLRGHLQEFSPDQEIVAYCRGPYCVLAQEAVSILRKEGLNAVRLSDGIAEWTKAGMKVISK